MEMLCLKHFGEILRKQLGDGGMFTDASVLTLISALVINRLEGLACNLILLAVHSCPGTGATPL